MKMKLNKEEYEGKALLKPMNKKNPDGATEGEIVTVRKVEKVKLPKTGDTWLVTFKEYSENALALNKTNLKKMVDLYGDETDDWLKEKVKIHIVEANNPSGKGDNATVHSIRVKAPNWKYGDDEDEYDEGDETEQPPEPTEEEIKVSKIQNRRKK